MRNFGLFIVIMISFANVTSAFASSCDGVKFEGKYEVINLRKQAVSSDIVEAQTPYSGQVNLVTYVGVSPNGYEGFFGAAQTPQESNGQCSVELASNDRLLSGTYNVISKSAQGDLVLSLTKGDPDSIKDSNNSNVPVVAFKRISK